MIGNTHQQNIKKKKERHYYEEKKVAEMLFVHVFVFTDALETKQLIYICYVYDDDCL